MKITKWNDDCIYFSDGSIITYDHIQDLRIFLKAMRCHNQ